MTNKIYRKSSWVFLCFNLLIFCACKGKLEGTEPPLTETRQEKMEKMAVDSLKRHGLYNYLDSAYLYTYVYFGSFVIKQCGTVDINAVLPSDGNRRLICQDLFLLHVRIVEDSSSVFIGVSPLVNDSILSCYTLAGWQLPYEVKFNYKLKRFVQFEYGGGSWLRVEEDDPIKNYKSNLKVLIDSLDIKPNKKFIGLISKLAVS